MEVVKKKFEELKKTEENYILSSFLKSYRNSYECFALESDYFYQIYGDIFKDILKKSDVYLLYEAENLIVGWCIKSSDVLHYIYIRKSNRRQKLAQMLLKECGGYERVSFYNRDFKLFEKRKSTYAPFERYD